MLYIPWWYYDLFYRQTTGKFVSTIEWCQRQMEIDTDTEIKLFKEE